MLLRMFVLLALVLSAGICLLLDAFCSYTWLWLLPLLGLGFTVVFWLITFLFLLILCKRVDQDQEQEVDDPLYRKVAELVIESVIPMVRVSVKTKGLEKVPAEGRFMLVCNHVNDLDPAPILYALPGRQLAFIAKKEVRDMFIVGPVLHKLLGQFIGILKENQASIAVFPEGGIFADRKLHHFRPGVFKIAQKAEVPIVVCTLRNTRYLIDNLLHYKPSDVELRVLTVIPR